MSSYLSAAENLLGTDLTSPGTVVDVTAKLSTNEWGALTTALIDFERAWAPDPAARATGIHFGRAYDTLKYPQSAWRSDLRDRLPFVLDATRLATLLVYCPSVSVWVPSFINTKYSILERALQAPKPDLRFGPLVDVRRALVLLAGVRPYLEDGSIQVVPDKYYEELVGYSDATPGPIQHLSRSEALRPEFRSILGEVDFIPDDIEVHCSEDRYIHTLSNADAIRFNSPMNELNEDIAVQSTLAGTLACSTDAMFRLLQCKYGQESVRTRESSWSDLSAQLPKLTNASLPDLLAIRNNEDAFQLWRTSLSDVIRRWESASKGTNGLDEAEARAIFNEATLPVRMGIEAKIKSKTLKSNIESSGVSFTTGAIAAGALSLDPMTAIATGAASSSLKLVYDVLKGRGAKPDKALLRMYAHFGGLQ